MMLILKDNLVKLLHSEDLNELVADQTKLFCISQLKHDGNKEVLYNLIR